MRSPGSTATSSGTDDRVDDVCGAAGSFEDGVTIPNLARHTVSVSPSSRGRGPRRGPATDPSLTALWVLRGVWLLVPLLVGRGVLAGIEEASAAVRTTVEVGLWLGWFAGFVALLAPSAVSLTTVRIVAAAAPASAVLAGLMGRWNVSVGVAVVAGVLLAALCSLPHVGAPMINGSAYGSERRMALRPPASLLFGPIQLAWLLVYAGLVTGPLLLAARQWLIGAVAVVVGFSAAVVGVRSLHQLARRWLVFVPAGFVIHDYSTLAESVLILRRLKPRLGALVADDASADDETAPLDLSRGAMGLPLVVEVDEPLPVAVRQGRSVQTRAAQRIVFSPTLPGAALAEARLRAIEIG